MRAGQDTRPPRGALVVIAVGLIACVAAALLSTDKPIGATELAWGAQTSIPDSKPVAIPGGGTMRIGDAGLRDSVTNAAGYTLFRVAATLEISRGAAIGHGRAQCLGPGARTALVAQTPNGRAAYPQPSEELSDQPVPRSLMIEFSVAGIRPRHGQPPRRLRALHQRARRQSRVGEIPTGSPGMGLGPARRPPAKPLTLPFATIFRTPAKPAARIACTLTTGRGTARVAMAGALRK